MYELGMMYVNPEGICTDRFGNTREEAFSVWKKFVDGRGDIKKTIIKEDEPEYSNRHSEDEGKFYLENIIFSKKPSIWLGKLIARGEELVTKTGISVTWIEEICRNYFKNRYEGS